MGIITACAPCRNTTTAMSASTTIALLRTMIDACETVRAGTPVGASSSCTGDSGDVAIGFRKNDGGCRDIRARPDSACRGGLASQVVRGVQLSYVGRRNSIRPVDAEATGRASRRSIAARIDFDALEG